MMACCNALLYCRSSSATNAQQLALAYLLVYCARQGKATALLISQMAQSQQHDLDAA